METDTATASHVTTLSRMPRLEVMWFIQRLTMLAAAPAAARVAYAPHHESGGCDRPKRALCQIFGSKTAYQLLNLARQSGILARMARTRLSICDKPGCTGSSTCKECRAIYRRMKRAGAQGVDRSPKPVAGGSSPPPAAIQADPEPLPTPPPVAKTAREIMGAIKPRSGDPIGDWNRLQPSLEGVCCAAQVHGVQCGKQAVWWDGPLAHCEEHRLGAS
jgi:hypothetical protein